jgi:hypothetical protein
MGNKISADKEIDKIGKSTRIEKSASITQVPNSDCIVIGSVQGILTLFKLDSNGDQKWKKVYGSESSDQGTRVFEKVNKNVLRNLL